MLAVSRRSPQRRRRRSGSSPIALGWAGGLWKCHRCDTAPRFTAAANSACRRYRTANTYEAVDQLLTTALDKSATLQSRLGDYHKALPELAH